MIRRLLPFLVALFVLAASSSAWALTLDDVKEMAKVGVPDSIVIQTVANSEEVFHLSAQDIIDLKQEGISDAVIEALQATSGNVESRSTDTREEDVRTRDRDDARDRARDDDRDRTRDDDRDRDADRDRTRDDDRDRTRGDDTPRRRSSEDDDDSMIRRRRRGDDDDDDDRSRSRVKRTPKEIKSGIDNYKEKKYLTSSLKLYRLLESGKYPDHEAKIHYYLGANLKAMGLLHAAQYHFQEVVKAGPSTGALFSGALAKMVEISDKTRDPIYLIRTIDKIDPDDYPGKVKDDLYYYQGVRDFERKDYKRAKRNFDKLGKSSDHYVQARYHLGVIYNAEDRRKAAIRTFADIVRSDFRGEPATIAHIKQLSYVNMARIRYSVEQYERAAELYERLPRGTTYWPTAMYESAWAYFMGENREYKALGQLLTLGSPFFDDVWLPESQILEALTFYRICEYKEVERILDEFKGEYGPVTDTIVELLAPYEAGDRPLRDLYQRLYGVRSKEYRDLPVAVYSHIEANRQFAGPHNRVLQIEAELQRIRSLKPQWRDAEVGKATEDLLKKQRKVYMKFAGVALANELAAIKDQLADLMGQEALIRFEVVSGEYEKYAAAFRNPEVAEVNELVEIDFATNPDVVFWPFNDEFWQDELGYYERVEPGDCKE